MVSIEPLNLLNCLLRNQSFLCFLGTSNLDDLMNSLNCIMNVPVSFKRIGLFPYPPLTPIRKLYL